MSVTIVTTPAAMAPATIIDDTSGKLANSNDASAGLDFASLLLGQLLPIAQEATTTGGNTAAEATPDTSLTTDATAAVLASLGLTPQSPVQSTDKSDTAPTEGISKSDAPLLPLTERQATYTTSAIRPDDAASPAIAQTTQNGTPVTDDQPAKFAVPALAEAIQENMPSKTLAAEIQPNTISPVANSATTHTNSLQPGHASSLSVPTPIRDQNWATDFGQKIMWLANSEKQTAQLTLNPPQMGPIDISLNIEKGNATASFVSANADVREAIETAMPRLREMFASAGISLGQTNVSAESFKQQAGNENGGQSAQWARDNAILGTEASGSLISRAAYTQRGTGMVDLFA